MLGNRQALHIEEHELTKSALEDKQISILEKCRAKFDCLVFEMISIKELSPVFNNTERLNVPYCLRDSFSCKLFTLYKFYKS